jgi:hypothetical protein
MSKFSNPGTGAPFNTAVKIEVVPSSELTPIAWNEIWTLTKTFFDTDRAYSESKLKEYQLVALFRSRNDDRLVGMASMDIYPSTFRGRRIAVIYTSHVLLRQEYRGHNLIQRLGWWTFLKTRLRFPFHSIYWFFETFSYKGYLLLPRNFREYWPRMDRKMPEEERALMDQLATRTYGADWRPQLGLVFRSGKKRLKPDAAPLNHNVPLTPELRFFSKANPGYAEGDMLVCLCPLSLTNWLSVGVRAFQRMRKAGDSSASSNVS